MKPGRETASLRLSGSAFVHDPLKARLQQDLHRSLGDWWPDDLRSYILEQYQADLTGSYAGCLIRNPFGKASGQLSMNSGQIEDAAQAGLGFTVLKTAIAQNAAGEQSMGAWAVPQARMVVEPITGRGGREGWTVTWKGRGWAGSFADYLQLCRDSFEISKTSGMLVAPSVKFHLPADASEAWRTDEYQYTLAELLKACRDIFSDEPPMPLEKDFSPTLAGDDRGQQKELIRRWLEEIVPVIGNASGGKSIRLGLKLMNFIGDDHFQREMLLTCLHASSRADFLVYANRLFDPNRIFEGSKGVAYGGPDLSDRNLAVLEECRDIIRAEGMEISGTGDIDCGRTAVEYGLRGCTSVQLHTAFQVPMQQQVAAKAGRTRRTLARLIFDPADGLVAWLCHARQHWGLVDEKGTSRWLDLPKCFQ